MAKYKYIGKNIVKIDKAGKRIELPANCMGGHKLMHGDTVEFDERLSAKAELLPTYERIKPGPKPKDQREEQFGVSAKDKEVTD